MQKNIVAELISKVLGVVQRVIIAVLTACDDRRVAIFLIMPPYPSNPVSGHGCLCSSFHRPPVTEMTFNWTAIFLSDF